MTKPTAQMINPRDAGLRGLDLKRPLFDEDTVARADNTLKAMGDSMVQWLDADVERLQHTRLAAEDARWSHAALETLGRVAHDLKGMGGTYGFPSLHKSPLHSAAWLRRRLAKASRRRIRAWCARTSMRCAQLCVTGSRRTVTPPAARSSMLLKRKWRSWALRRAES